uniref:lipocalin-like domain-containing protein n=1 Tax=Segatella hominis TaxID=2518605 RepID=UPI00402985E2
MFTKKYKIVHAMMVAFVAISMFAFSSCELESSDNGKLDGFWHLESIDSLENGKTVDMSKLHVFWGIEYKLIAATQYDNKTERMFFRFEQTSDSLKITQAFINHGHQDNGGDIPLTEVTNDLRYYGINNLPEGFAKEALSGSKMILRSKTLRLKFKKF